jgi:hypothetical protein
MKLQHLLLIIFSHAEDVHIYQNPNADISLVDLN